LLTNRFTMSIIGIFLKWLTTSTNMIVSLHAAHNFWMRKVQCSGVPRNFQGVRCLTLRPCVRQDFLNFLFLWVSEKFGCWSLEIFWKKTEFLNSRNFRKKLKLWKSQKNSFQLENRLESLVKARNAGTYLTQMFSVFFNTLLTKMIY